MVAITKTQPQLCLVVISYIQLDLNCNVQVVLQLIEASSSEVVWTTYETSNHYRTGPGECNKLLLDRYTVT